MARGYREVAADRKKRRIAERCVLECMRRHDQNDSRFGFRMKFLIDNSGCGHKDTKNAVRRLLNSYDIGKKDRTLYILKDNGWGRLYHIDSCKQFNPATGTRE